jgi:hypothetical protein
MNRSNCNTFDFNGTRNKDKLNLEKQNRITQRCLLGNTVTLTHTTCSGGACYIDTHYLQWGACYIDTHYLQWRSVLLNTPLTATVQW